MPTGGTYAFAMSRDAVIAAALRKIGRFPAGETIPAIDITTCAEALNVMCKRMAIQGLPLWCVREYTIPLIAGQATYDLSAATTMQRPLRILDAFIRQTASGNDVTIELESRYDYDGLGMKSSRGVPNQGFYDPQLGACTITLYNVPQDSSQELHVIVQRQIQDVNLASENLDFPQEAYGMLIWNLAGDIALEYSVPTDVRQEIALRAAESRIEFFAAEQEQVSIRFTANTQGRG